MKVAIQWYDGTGGHVGHEHTTLAEITTRLGYSLRIVEPTVPNPKLVAIARLVTGEVARIYKASTPSTRQNI